MLGLTAVEIAWVSWVAATHTGGQSLSFTKSNNLAAEGNSKWNEASQKLSTEWATGINNALVLLLLHCIYVHTSASKRSVLIENNGALISTPQNLLLHFLFLICLVLTYLD